MYFRIALVTIWLAILVISIILKSIKSMKPYWQDWLRFCRLLISFQYVVTLQVLKRFRSEIKTEGRMILSATQTTHLKPCKVNEGRLTYDEANWVISPIIYHFLFWCLVILREMINFHSFAESKVRHDLWKAAERCMIRCVWYVLFLSIL